MAEQSSKSLFTREALALLDEEEDGIDDNFFPGSNEDLILNSDEEVSNAGGDEEDSAAEEDEEKHDAGENVENCIECSYEMCMAQKCNTHLQHLQMPRTVRRGVPRNTQRPVYIW